MMKAAILDPNAKKTKVLVTFNFILKKKMKLENRDLICFFKD